MPETPEITRFNVLGVGVSAIDMATALDLIMDWVRSGARQYVCVSTVHSIMACHDDPSLRQIHNQAGLVTPDGMPLVWLAQAAGHGSTQRVYGPDLMLAVCAASIGQGVRHFFFGGAPGIAERLAGRLTERFPGLDVAGWESPPFGLVPEAEDDATVERINRAGADIVWVGLGAPRQERWMADRRDRLQAPVLIGVGAAFDIHSGAKPQAPRWMQRTGLEWLFRLLTEPKRLWRRYMFNNPRFVVLVALQALGLRRYPLPRIRSRAP